MDTWFRLRHLQSVSCRNLSISTVDLKYNEIFFALSTTEVESLGYFYKSSKSKNILNPDWNDLDFSYSNIRKFSYLDKFTITFFLHKNNKNKILCEVKIHISGLKSLDKYDIEDNTDPQKLLFQFKNNWFVICKGQYKLKESNDGDLQCRIKGLKQIYKNDTINRFFNILNNTRGECQDMRYQLLENNINESRKKMVQCSQINHRVIALNEYKALLNKNIYKKKESLNGCKSKLRVLKQKIERVTSNFERIELEVIRNRSIMKNQSSAYDKISQNYINRMYQLIRELSMIFPINPTVTPSPLPETKRNQSTFVTIYSTDKLSICDLHLPNSDREILLNQDAVTLGALGMVFRLIVGLSQIYDIPLRYSLCCEGHRMIVRDHIIDIDDSERNFLIAKNTSASFKLQYAIYLMNLNIVALRGYFGLQTKYHDRTLWNINTLIEGKSKFISKSSSMTNLTNATSPTLSQRSAGLSPLVTGSPKINEKF